MTIKIGDKFVVSKELNSDWAGEGTVKYLPSSLSHGRGAYVTLIMTSGNWKDMEGGFEVSKLIPVLVPEFSGTKYVVEFLSPYGPKWKRSANHHGGKPLNEIEFYTRAGAEEAAARQQKFMGNYMYRAVAVSASPLPAYVFKAGDRVQYKNILRMTSGMRVSPEREGKFGTVEDGKIIPTTYSPLGMLRVKWDGEIGSIGAWIENLKFVIRAYQVGDHVKVTYGYGWDGEGVIEAIKGDNVDVRFTTGQHKSRTGGFYSKHLMLLPIDKSRDIADSWAYALPAGVGNAGSLETGERKQKGMGTYSALAKAAGHSDVFKIAKDAAVLIGKQIRYVNIEHVQLALKEEGYKPSDLGNAAGGIFRGKNWKDTGKTINSSRATSRARKVTVWEYVGSL